MAESFGQHLLIITGSATRCGRTDRSKAQAMPTLRWLGAWKTGRDELGRELIRRHVSIGRLGHKAGSNVIRKRHRQAHAKKFTHAIGRLRRSDWPGSCGPSAPSAFARLRRPFAETPANPPGVGGQPRRAPRRGQARVDQWSSDLFCPEVPETSARSAGLDARGLSGSTATQRDAPGYVRTRCRSSARRWRAAG